MRYTLAVLRGAESGVSFDFDLSILGVGGRGPYIGVEPPRPARFATHCNECNRPCHTAYTPKSVTTTSEKWYYRRCTAKTRVPHTTKMTLKETHAPIKRLTKLAHSRRIAETEQRAKDLKSIESKYPHSNMNASSF